ncbi:hypothetical protein CTAYLR_009272 [Chrysophaeum taylorii]|uniref:Ankyrin repeat protein n=1 Tax=Chrysophaeum taylorii TaxID=2483200 RepID=A0AAD7XKM9_9STRA|nr:hypothetical protein CTAYLR_009272 [Chrysophaeum taylorii]
MLIDLNAVALLNSVDDDDCSLEQKRFVLRKMVKDGDDWVLELLDGVSDEALAALIQKRITNQSQLVEISKLFDKVGVANHKRDLLTLMVPGRDYDPHIDENVHLPNGVRPNTLKNGKDLEDFVELGAINWIGWLLGNNFRLQVDVCPLAARTGQLDVLKWARANKFWWTSCTCAEAARGGHLDVLVWARANNCPWDEHTCSRAAFAGHLHIIKWARARGCPWSEMTCAEAARGGHLEVLKWARANGCPWDVWTYVRASLHNHREVLDWARANGCAMRKDRRLARTGTPGVCARTGS